MHLNSSVPHVWLYWEAGFAVWILAQIVTGKGIYRSRFQSSENNRRQVVFTRQEQPAIFWVIIANQALPVLALFCSSIGFEVGMYIGAIVWVVLILGTLVWALGSIIRQRRQKNRLQG